MCSVNFEDTIFVYRCIECITFKLYTIIQLFCDALNAHYLPYHNNLQIHNNNTSATFTSIKCIIIRYMRFPPLIA